MNNLAIFMASLAGLITASAGAWALWRKLKPETTNIQVTSADTLIAIATETATLVKNDRDDLRVEVSDLRKKLDMFEQRVLDAEQRADVAERRANEAEKRADTAETRLEVLVRENFRLKNRIAHLEQEVRELKSGNPHS